MVNLDNLLVYKKYDSSGMLNHLKHFPQQCDNAWHQAMSFKIPDNYANVTRVVILGMGGSAIGGEILSDLAMRESTIPIWVHRDFDLPAFVDDKTLVIAISYSGNTEETLSGFNKLMQTPAKKMVLTAGGRLAELAGERNLPLALIDYRAPPRAAFPFMFSWLLGILYRLGVLNEETADVRRSVPLLEKMVPELDVSVPTGSNRAKQLATELNGNLAVIYGAGILSGVARRWKTQLNENSKSWAFCEVFPELLHNAVVGYKFPASKHRDVLLVLLRSNLLHPRILVQYQAVIEVLAENGISYKMIDASGESVLTQILSAILLGDFVSYYLSVLCRTDPGPVDAIDYIKKYLAGH